MLTASDQVYSDHRHQVEGNVISATSLPG